MLTLCEWGFYGGCPMPPDNKYQITITIAFTLDVTAKNEDEAINKAECSWPYDGDPNTLEIECRLIEGGK